MNEEDYKQELEDLKAKICDHLRYAKLELAEIEKLVVKE